MVSTLFYVLEWFSISRQFRISKSSAESTNQMSALEQSFEKELSTCLFFFFCFYVGSEMVFSNFIYSFGICHLEMSRDRATMLTSLFWLFFTIFRFLSAVQVKVENVDFFAKI